MENEFSNRISVKNIVLAGMFAAFLAVMSQVSLPMPTGVPITVQVFAVALVGVILGWKRGVLAVLVYILIGAVGVPVFANFKFLQFFIKIYHIFFQNTMDLFIP